MRRLTCLAVAVLLPGLAILAGASAASQGKDAKGKPVRTAKKTGHVSNYDEAKVKPYTLPDPLKLADGQPVRDAATWFKKRRPEILKLYQTEIFGRVPVNAPRVTWEVASTDAKALDGRAVEKQVVGRMGDKADGPRMNLTLYVPAKATGSVPVILTLTFSGGKGLKFLGDKGNSLRDEILGRGWAYAILGYSDIQPDRPNAFGKGVIGLTLAPGRDKPADDEWGGVSAWAWGVSRAVDYFQTYKAIDPNCIGIQGHSRLGRTVLWAAAQDERIAATFASCSGCTGAALFRRDWGETVDDMAQNFPYQLAGNYQKWVGRWNDMPVDNHMLIALVAPRALFCSGGTGDQWADPKGQFLALVAAGPVYELVGAKGLGASELPPLDRAVIDGDLGWIYHTGGHTTPLSDWRAFLDFAGRHFQAAGKASKESR
jgi:hypothetical protein